MLESESQQIILLDQSDCITAGVFVKMATRYCSNIKPNLCSHCLEQTHKVKGWKCEGLYLNQQNEPNPLIKINHIQFSQLIRLELWNNSIQTIEPLSWLKAPLLQELSIPKNKITSITPLGKICSKNIRQMDMSSNLIRQGNAIVQGDWKHLQQIWIDYPQVYSQIQSIKFFSKLQFREGSQIFVRVDLEERITENLAIESLTRKVKPIKVQTFRQTFNSQNWTNQ